MSRSVFLLALNLYMRKFIACNSLRWFSSTVTKCILELRAFLTNIAPSRLFSHPSKIRCDSTYQFNITAHIFVITGTMKQMNKTVELLQRLVTRNITLLEKKRKDRPLFLALDDFLQWVFEQTRLLHGRSRTKCMMLFCSICLSIPGKLSHALVVSACF